MVSTNNLYLFLKFKLYIWPKVNSIFSEKETGRKKERLKGRKNVKSRYEEKRNNSTNANSTRIISSVSNFSYILVRNIFPSLFICGLFNDAINNSVYAGSNDWSRVNYELEMI